MNHLLGIAPVVSGSDRPALVLLVHGMWLHATSWDPWIQRFGKEGLVATAPGWPGDADTVEEARETPESIADHGLEDVAVEMSRVAARYVGRPVVVGQGAGGRVARMLLDRGIAAAAVAIDPDRMSGALPFGALSQSGNPANRHRAFPLTVTQFRVAFGGAIPERESADLYDRWAIPAPGKPLFEFGGDDPRPPVPAEPRGRLLVVCSGVGTSPRGRILPRRQQRGSVETVHLPDRGPSLTIDHGWRGVADVVLGWLAAS